MLLTCAWITGLWAQPANDNCAGAQELILSVPPNCPSAGQVTNVFTSDNIGATPAIPYPSFNYCATGNGTDHPAAEVWYKFTATSNKVTIRINGDLQKPNLVLFSGNNCTFLNSFYCASAAPGEDSLTITTALTLGHSYYIMVSGSDANDQGNFEISITSFRDCSPCLQQASLAAFPPSINGVYSAGQEVIFCFVISGWNVTGTVEWLHAVEVDMGPGWDLNTLSTFVPQSCGGDGSWAWYNSWTGCNTGETFGPGFAYDSWAGLGCGGVPGDNNPGNNWGDGTNGCANITTDNSFVFCWKATVANPLPDTIPHDLSVEARVLSDGDSGSWTQTGCNNGITYQILASAIPFTDLPPLALGRAVFCEDDCSGQLRFSGNSDSGDTLWNYSVFDSDENLIYQSFQTAGMVTLDALCTGTYTVVVSNPLSGSSRAISVEVPEPGLSWGQDMETQCEGSVITYASEIQDTSLSYLWIFEGGHPATATSPEIEVNYAQAGSYATTLVVGNGTCFDTLVQNQAVHIIGQPLADFDLNAAIATLQCTNTSQNSAVFRWDFGDGSSSSETNPAHTYSESGDYLVQLIAENACGSDTFSRQVNITIVSSNEIRFNPAFKIYPNPGSGKFTLELEAHPAPIADLMLFDALGQVICSEKIGFQNGKLKKMLALEHLSTGLYWLSIKTQDFNITRKVIFQY